QPADVDEPVRRLHAEAHEVDEGGAAAEEPRAGPVGQRGDRAVGVGRALVGERPHPATSRMAATMFTYAPQRQRLPLIRSRISSSGRSAGATRSAGTAVWEA